MVIDASAVLAVLFREPEAESFLSAIIAAPARVVGAPSHLEVAMLLTARRGPTARRELDELLATVGARVAPFTEAQARLAAVAFERYGKGRHPAGLNFGDCCSYALAKESGEPLLFKGRDFSQTDVASAATSPGI
jgi:ribonuclease VapC